MLTSDAPCALSEFCDYFANHCQSQRLFLSSPQSNISFNAENAARLSAWLAKRGEIDEQRCVLVLRQFTDQAASEGNIEMKNVAVGVVDFASTTITFLAPNAAKQTYAQHAVAGVTISPPADLHFVAIDQITALPS